MKSKNIADEVWDWVEDFFYGFSTSITVSFLWEQFIHILAVVIGGVLLTIANHYVRKHLLK